MLAAHGRPGSLSLESRLAAAGVEPGAKIAALSGALAEAADGPGSSSSGARVTLLVKRRGAPRPEEVSFWEGSEPWPLRRPVAWSRFGAFSSGYWKLLGCEELPGELPALRGCCPKTPVTFTPFTFYCLLV